MNEEVAAAASPAVMGDGSVDDSTEDPKARRERWLYPLAVLFFALFSVGMRWPALEAGLQTDDYAQYAMIRGEYPGSSSRLFDAYAFIADDPDARSEIFRRGIVPWWAQPGIFAHAARPLSSLLLAFDHWVAPIEQPGSLRLWHLHSLGWLFFSLLAAGLALGRLLSLPMRLATLALLASDISFILPVTWVANRCSLISATFVWLSLWSYVRWRQATPAGAPYADRRLAFRSIASLLLFTTLALAAGEYGVSALGFVVAYEAIGVPGRRGGRQRLAALAPMAALVLTYAILHMTMGFGLARLGGYVGVGEVPIEGLLLAAERYRDLVAAGLWALPAQQLITMHILREYGFGEEARVFYEWHEYVLLVLVALGLGLAGWATARLDREDRRSVLALGLGGLFACVPVLFAPPGQRLLVVASLGFCAAMGAVVVVGMRVCVRAFRERRVDLRKTPWVLAALVVIMVHVVAEQRFGRRGIRDYEYDKDRIARVLEDGDLLEHSPAGRDVVILNIYDFNWACYGAFVLPTLGYPRARTWRALSMLNNDAILSRPTENTLEIATVHEHWFSSIPAGFYRGRDAPLPVGSVVDVGEMRVEVVADFERNPVRVRFVFPHSLDDPRYLFAYVEEQALHRWEPIEVGSRAALPAPRMRFRPRF